MKAKLGQTKRFYSLRDNEGEMWEGWVTYWDGMIRVYDKYDECLLWSTKPPLGKVTQRTTALAFQAFVESSRERKHR